VSNDIVLDFDVETNLLTQMTRSQASKLTSQSEVATVRRPWTLPARSTTTGSTSRSTGTLGAALARLQGRIAIDEVLDRRPSWEVDFDRAEPAHTRPSAAGRGCRYSRIVDRAIARVQ